MRSEYDALGTDCSPAHFAIATRVAQKFFEPARNPRTQQEDWCASGLPGDTGGRLVNPEPYTGQNLSKNPHPKISPQTMPATIERPFSGVHPGSTALKLTTKVGEWPEVSLDDDPRHQAHHSPRLRALVR
jgi:hypothetical protein